MLEEYERWNKRRKVMTMTNHKVNTSKSTLIYIEFIIQKAHLSEFDWHKTEKSFLLNSIVTHSLQRIHSV